MIYKKTRPEDILSEFPKKYRDCLAKEIYIYMGIVGVKMVFDIVSLNYMAKEG